MENGGTASQGVGTTGQRPGRREKHNLLGGWCGRGSRAGRDDQKGRGLLLSARGGWRDSPQGTGMNRKQVQATKSTLGGTHGIHSGLRLYRCRSTCPPLLTRPPAPTPSLRSKTPLPVSLEPLPTQRLSWRFSADEPGKQNNLRRGRMVKGIFWNLCFLDSHHTEGPRGH